jgi:hypothetical protein
LNYFKFLQQYISSLKITVFLITIVSFSLLSISLSAQSKREKIQNLTTLLDSLTTESLRKEKECNDNILRQEIQIADNQRNLNSLLEKNKNYQVVNALYKTKIDSLENFISTLKNEIKDDFNRFYIDEISLSDLIGKSVNSIDFQTLLNRLSEPEIYRSNSPFYTYRFYSEGIEIFISEKSVIEYIMLYLHQDNLFQPFQGKLGCMLSKEMSKKEVDQLLGDVVYQDGFIFDKIQCTYNNGLIVQYERKEENFQIRAFSLTRENKDLESDKINVFLSPENSHKEFKFETINGDYQFTQGGRVLIDSTYFDPSRNDRIILCSNKKTMTNEDEMVVAQEKYFIGINDSPYGYRTLFILDEQNILKRIAEGYPINATSASWYNENTLFIDCCLEGFCDLYVYKCNSNTVSRIELPDKTGDCYSPYINSILPISNNTAALVIEYEFNGYEECNYKNPKKPLPELKFINF